MPCAVVPSSQQCTDRIQLCTRVRIHRQTGGRVDPHTRLRALTPRTRCIRLHLTAAVELCVAGHMPRVTRVVAPTVDLVDQNPDTLLLVSGATDGERAIPRIVWSSIVRLLIRQQTGRQIEIRILIAIVAHCHRCHSILPVDRHVRLCVILTDDLHEVRFIRLHEHTEGGRTSSCPHHLQTRDTEGVVRTGGRQPYGRGGGVGILHGERGRGRGR